MYVYRVTKLWKRVIGKFLMHIICIFHFISTNCMGKICPTP